jgi:DNA-binding NarL/FixJ family response regulator
MDKKKIIAVDDEPLIAVLMKEVIDEDPELEITKIASEKADFLNSVEQGHFDAALIDISIGGREGGIELLQAVKAKGINLPLIILSAHDELLYALKCLKAGARGYINKKYICTDVVTCLKEVIGGRMFVSGDKGAYILNQYKQLAAPAGIESSR